nr:uncharacterized protein LOC127315786 [Lolium perenne]
MAHRWPEPPGRRKTGGSHHAPAAPRHPPDPWTSTQPLRRGTARPPTTHAQPGRRSRRGEDVHRGRRPGIPTSGERTCQHRASPPPPPFRSRTSTRPSPPGPAERPVLGKPGAPPSAAAHGSSPAAARSKHTRRHANVAARSSPQGPPSSPWPPTSARPAAGSTPRARGCAEEPPSRGPPPRVRARSGRADPSQPSSPSAAEDPKGAAAAPSAHPRAATRDEVPAAAHSRTSFARRSAPAAAEGGRRRGRPSPAARVSPPESPERDDAGSLTV